MTILTVGQLVIYSKRNYMRSNDLSNTNILCIAVKHFAESFQTSSFNRMVKTSDQKHFESKVGGT